MLLHKLIGILGLILITTGVITKKRKKQDILYIMGGLCLIIYSIFIRDLIFIILQVIFTLATIADLIKNK